MARENTFLTPDPGQCCPGSSELPHDGWFELGCDTLLLTIVKDVCGTGIAIHILREFSATSEAPYRDIAFGCRRCDL